VARNWGKKLRVCSHRLDVRISARSLRGEGED
jgi:hypothetical protein